MGCRWQGHAPMRVVANAAGLFVGCARSFDPTHGWVNVAGVRMETTSVPELGEIVITLDPTAPAEWHVNGTGTRCLWWHHESGPGLRSVSARATACNVALMRALGRTLGGTVVLEDTGRTPEEVYAGPDGVNLWAEGGADWYRLQALLASIRPLTAKDFDAVREYAAY